METKEVLDLINRLMHLIEKCGEQGPEIDEELARECDGKLTEIYGELDTFKKKIIKDRL